MVLSKKITIKFVQGTLLLQNKGLASLGKKKCCITF